MTIAVPMSEPAGNLVWLSHPRLASTAMSALPAWLWSIDATRLLWANPTGAAIFDAPTSATIRASSFGSRGPAAIQVARLAAGGGPAVRAGAGARRGRGGRAHLRLLVHHASRPHPRHPGGRDRARRR